MSKCAKTFQNALQIRTNVLKQQSSRRSRFSHAGKSPMIQLNSPLFKRPAAPVPVEEKGLRRRQPVQEQQQQQRPSMYTHQSRVESASQVESTIVELSGMYTRMANMVAEQGEVVGRIDDDMDMAQLNIEAGQNELLKYFKTVSGNRALILKLFAVILVIIFLFTVVF